MSEPDRDAAPHELQQLQARLAEWRASGASRADPVRFHFLEALARRLQAVPPAWRERLHHRLSAGVAAYAERLAQAQQAAAELAAPLLRQSAQTRQLRSLQAAGDVRGLRWLAARASGPEACAPLAQLNRHAREASPALQGAGPEAGGREELASVRRFRRTWSRGRSQEQLARASSRMPVNAGPLNSHALVLQSLALMQELSPDYLRHFLTHVEALQWLEMARDAPPPEASKGVRAGKPSRTSRRK